MKAIFEILETSCLRHSIPFSGTWQEEQIYMYIGDAPGQMLYWHDYRGKNPQEIITMLQSVLAPYIKVSTCLN